MSEEVPPLRRNRDFLLLWSGSAVSSLGANASSVAYPLLVLALTGSPVDAGLSGFIALLPQLVFQVPAGALVDRWNRKRVMIWCDILRALAIGTLAVALVSDSLTLPHILAVGFVEGVLTVTFKIAAAAAVPNVVHPSHLTFALSRNEARERGAAMLGQPLGGALFGLGRAVPFLFDAVTYLVSLVSLLLIRTDFQAERKPRRLELGAGIAWLWRQPFLRMTTFLVAGSNFLFRALFLVVIVMAADYGASPTLVGVMFGLAAVGGVLGSLAAPALERRLSMKVVVIAANWAWGLLVPMVLLVPNPYVLGAVYALMCFVGPVWNVAISAYQLAVTPDHIQGRVLGAAGMIAFGAVPLGSLLGGFALEWIGARATVWALAVWMIGLAIVATVSPAVRNAPSLDSARPVAEPVAVR
ncbi:MULTISPECIES: MFS transporter [unclassified Crossiella]|uniref:MFS transporter n=1 Tax=unclassified Crossiella TaxID=2620835 RepID=UPI00200048BF|nr:MULTISPECIES: MFS transporter [unclassified Crossiella]MCK2241506.1 MFS transporter [Crossiella sp. S99.2]MCK2255622.1 MFS transporter [Crossiella sp. S99.1]